MHTFKFLLLCFLLLTTGCDNSVDRADIINKYDTAYVVIEPASMNSLNKQLSADLSNYGEVKQDSFIPIYKYSSVIRGGRGEDLAFKVYLEDKLIPSGEMYMAVNCNDFLRTVASGAAKIENVSINPDIGGPNSFVMFSDEIKEMVPRLKKSEPASLSVFVKK